MSDNDNYRQTGNAAPAPSIQPSARLGRGALGGDDDCSAMIARLYYFLDGELTDERRTHIQSHLDACPSCFGAFDFEAELRIVVRSRVQTRVPEKLIERVRSVLHLPGPGL